MYKLYVLGEHGCGNRRAVSRERVPRRNNCGNADRQQRFAGNIWRHAKQRAHQADIAVPVDHGLDHGARFDLEIQQRRREFLLEGGDSSSKRSGRKHHIDGHAQFRFKSAGRVVGTLR